MSISEKEMGEEQNIRELEKPKMFIPRLSLEPGKKIPVATAAAEAISYSVPSSPRTSLLKQSGKINCLCSPTTHRGSFRCRYHRNKEPTSQGLTRSSMSVGSRLSELARKPTGGSVIC